jgi:hypothetical protein
MVKNYRITIKCRKETLDLFKVKFLEFKMKNPNATYEDFLKSLISPKYKVV